MRKEEEGRGKKSQGRGKKSQGRKRRSLLSFPSYHKKIAAFPSFSWQSLWIIDHGGFLL
jgi:hypothetical protein